MSDQNNREEIYSRPVRAGKRTYFFDVKATGPDVHDHYGEQASLR